MGVQRREVVPGGLHVGTVLDGVAEADEDVLDLLADLADEVLGALGEVASGKRDVRRLGVDPGREHGLLELELALGDGSVHIGAHLVRELAHGGALLGRELAHHLHGGRERTLLARHGDADLLERIERARVPETLLGLGLDGLEIVENRHVPCLPFRRAAATKKPPLTSDAKDGKNPRYHLD